MIHRDETRRRILDAAAAMFDRFGPVKTSVADVARELRMSPANIYNFFPSKDALFEELGETYFRELERDIQARVTATPDPWDAICCLFLEIARHIRARISNEKDLIQLQMISNKNEWKFMRNFHGFVVCTLENLIGILIRERGLGGLDAAQAATALFDCMVVAINPALILHSASDSHEARLRAQLALLERAFTPVHGTAP